VHLPVEQITAVVLAGGLGTRLRSVLPDLPKPMAPVNGRPFVEWVVRYLAAQGIQRVVISTGYRADVIASHFEREPVRGVSVRCVAEPESLGTAGGFLYSVRATAEPPAAWLVVNGDSLTLAPLQSLFAGLEDPEVNGSLLAIAVPDASRYGTVEANARGELIAFHEKRPGSGLINAGVYLFRAALVEAFPGGKPLSFERDVFPFLVREGRRIKVCVTQADFLDIGTPESLPMAEGFVREHAGWFQG